MVTGQGLLKAEKRDEIVKGYDPPSREGAQYIKAYASVS